MAIVMPFFRSFSYIGKTDSVGNGVTVGGSEATVAVFSSFRFISKEYESILMKLYEMLMFYIRLLFICSFNTYITTTAENCFLVKILYESIFFRMIY